MNEYSSDRATGFVGSNLVPELVGRGFKVRALLNLRLITRAVIIVVCRSLGKKLTLCTATSHLESLADVCKGVDVVVHLAAISRPMKVEDSEYFDVNCKGTVNLVNSAIACGVQRFIYISSVSALGLSDNGFPLAENDFRPEPPLWVKQTKKRRTIPYRGRC